MSRTARAAALVQLDPEAAHQLWTNLRRWPTFVEGFAHVVEVSPEWPAEGSKLVWRSGPGGRGTVTERVVESSPSAFRTQVFEDALSGEQSVTFEPAEEGMRVELRLEYDLTSSGPLRIVSDVLFIRRALRDALRRTLDRFVVEAEEEAALR
jgi:hypothetical protein